MNFKLKTKYKVNVIRIMAKNSKLLLVKTMKNNPEKYGYIITIEDNKGQRTIELTQDAYSLGRSPKSEIIIYAERVSRYHATIIRKKSKKGNSYNFFIVDGDLKGNKSTNGIVVNGTYKASHQLKHGDVVHLGYHSTYGEKTLLKYFKFSKQMVEHFVKSGQSIEDYQLSGIMAKRESYKQTLIA
ncbi:MAG: FHA domain-containing protein [Prochloraceae cyanobacterium]